MREKGIRRENNCIYCKKIIRGYKLIHPRICKVCRVKGIRSINECMIKRGHRTNNELENKSKKEIMKKW